MSPRAHSATESPQAATLIYCQPRRPIRQSGECLVRLPTFFKVACETERILLRPKLRGGSVGPTPRAGRSCDSAGPFPSSPSRTSRGDRRGRSPLDTRRSLNRLVLPPSRQRQRLLLLLVPPLRQMRKLFLAKRVSAEVLCNTSSPPRPWLLLGRFSPLLLDKAPVSTQKWHPHHPATHSDPIRGAPRCSTLGCQNGCVGTDDDDDGRRRRRRRRRTTTKLLFFLEDARGENDSSSSSTVVVVSVVVVDRRRRCRRRRRRRRCSRPSSSVLVVVVVVRRRRPPSSSVVVVVVDARRRRPSSSPPSKHDHDDFPPARRQHREAVAAPLRRERGHRQKRWSVILLAWSVILLAWSVFLVAWSVLLLAWSVVDVIDVVDVVVVVVVVVVVAVLVAVAVAVAVAVSSRPGRKSDHFHHLRAQSQFLQRGGA